MAELIEVGVITEITKTPEQSSTKPTLKERREDLCLRLQSNRQFLKQKLKPDSVEQQRFPRSMTMQFLARPGTRQIIQRVAGTALGLQAFKSLRYGYSLVQFARSAYAAFKATRNVVKAKEGVSLNQ